MVLGALLSTLGGILLPKITDAALELGGDAINSGFKWLGKQLGFNYDKKRYRGSDSVGHRLMGLGRGIVTGKYTLNQGFEQAQDILRGKRKNPFVKRSEQDQMVQKKQKVEIQDLVPVYRQNIELDID